MKKLLLILALISLLFLFTGCSVDDIYLQNHSGGQAVVLMPDGTILTGICTSITRISYGWSVYVIDNKKYCLSEWRVAIIYEEER